MTDDPKPDELDDDGSQITEQPTVDAASPTTYARAQTKQIRERENVRQWWSRALRDPVGGKILWQLLVDLHVFEDERFAAAPNGTPHQEATEHARGQRDFGLRLYRTLVFNDREAVFALHDLYDPQFAKPKPPRRKKGND